MDIGITVSKEDKIIGSFENGIIEFPIFAVRESFPA